MGNDKKEVEFVESVEGYETYGGEEVDEEVGENEDPGEEEKTDREGLHVRLCE